MKSSTATADALFGIIVRSKGSCENCGDTFVLQCAHGFSRRYRNVRWDLRNAWCLCRACHMYYTHHGLEWDDWMRQKMGWRYDEVRAKALDVNRKPDMVAIIADLKTLKDALA